MKVRLGYSAYPNTQNIIEREREREKRMTVDTL